MSAGLTPREEAALALVAQGLTNKAIAVAPGISIDRVKDLVAQARRKLGAVNRAQAAAQWVTMSPGHSGVPKEGD